MGSIKHSKQRWAEYYKARKRDKTPNYLLNRAFRILANAKHAHVTIDVGCGTGADTLKLLSKGYQVLAIDAQAQAIRQLKRSVRPAWRSRLRTSTKRFEKIRKRDLPRASLVNASYCLFFCPPSAFTRFWRNLSGSLQQGGIFVGHFIGPRDDWAKRRGMMSLSKSKLKKLLQKDFKILQFKEEQNDDGTIVGKEKHWHLFSVTARKIHPT